MKVVQFRMYVHTFSGSCMCILGVVLIVSFASDAVFQEGSFVCA